MLTIAAGAAPPFFVDVALLILASALIAYICYRLGIIPIVGFLIAGVAIGPEATGLVSDKEIVDAAAEVGVLLLLFTIGIEFSLEKLARIKRLIFGGGGLQVGLTTGVTIAILMSFGVSWQASLFTGFLVALSSTAIVLKLLSDRGEMDEEHGQVGLGLLIFQDLAIIVMVLLVPLMSGQGGGSMEIVWALAKAASIIVAVLLFARRLMPKFLESVARTCSPELFLLTVIGICFGTAFLTSLAGVSLSLGAFLAGIVVSESKFSEHAMGEIMPLQILFSATFFVSVGMLLDVGFLVSNLPLVIGIVVLVLLIKIITTGISLRILGYPLPIALASGLMLAQIGEFSFVLERAGREAGLFPAGLEGTGSQTFIAATVIVMIMTPMLHSLGIRVRDRMTSGSLPSGSQADDEPVVHGHIPALKNHVIIAGYGMSAQYLVRSMRSFDIPMLVLTLSPEGASDAEKQDVHVLRGDYAKQHTLNLAHLADARTLIIADDNPGMAHRVAMVARQMNPDVHIVVRTSRKSDVHTLHEEGVDCVIVDELESIVQLLGQVLKDHDIPLSKIDEIAEHIRSHDYEDILSTPPTGSITLDPHQETCDHAHSRLIVMPEATDVCPQCVALGDSWVHLRLCMACGQVGCCDSSKNKHARAHFEEAGHPVIRSIETGETWGWCFVDDQYIR